MKDQKGSDRKKRDHANNMVINEAVTAFASKPFRAHPVFNGGHAQTIAAYLWPRLYRFQLPEDEARLFEVEPGIKVLSHCRWQENRKKHPTLVLWHGIEGSTSSVYMIATADKAFRSGFNVVRVNFRNCGGTEHLSRTLYHGGLSGDLRAVVNELIERDQLPRLALVGFSLGGNIVLKLAAEYGDEPPDQVFAVCAISPSVNLAASSDLICRNSNWIYHRDFVRRLRNRMTTKQKLYPELYASEKIKLVHTIRDFDELFTAALHGFADANDYYQKSSSIHIIDKITIPTLIIHAQDDPFIPFAPLRTPALESNSQILLLDPRNGGHVAFIAATTNGDEDRFWAENRAIDFCKLANELIYEEKGRVR